jgi:ATP-dependent protease HslVU (ClpYQ) ATPase subunit
MKELTPKKIVTELNRYIIGQENAKKVIAIAEVFCRQNLKMSSPLKILF